MGVPVARVLLKPAGMHREPSMGDALERTVVAGQSLIVSRLELFATEAKLFFRDGGTAIVVGAVAWTGWIFLVRGAIEGLAQQYPRFAVESAVGVLHLGAAMLCFVRMRTR